MQLGAERQVGLRKPSLIASESDALRSKAVSSVMLEKFGLEASTANHMSIKLGERSVYAAITDENCAAYVRGLNILGSDVLQLLVPDLVPLLISSLNAGSRK